MRRLLMAGGLAMCAFACLFFGFCAGDLLLWIIGGGLVIAALVAACLS